VAPVAPVGRAAPVGPAAVVAVLQANLAAWDNPARPGAPTGLVAPVEPAEPVAAEAQANRTSSAARATPV
jgi:hypothetical protein